MGTKWLIEYNGPDKTYPKWYDTWGWNSDPHQCRQFDTREDAELYRNTVLLDIVDDTIVTEHIFMSSISTEPNLN